MHRRSLTSIYRKHWTTLQRLHCKWLQRDTSSLSTVHGGSFPFATWLTDEHLDPHRISRIYHGIFPKLPPCYWCGILCAIVYAAKWGLILYLNKLLFWRSDIVSQHCHNIFFGRYDVHIRHVAFSLTCADNKTTDRMNEKILQVIQRMRF